MPPAARNPVPRESDEVHLVADSDETGSDISEETVELKEEDCFEELGFCFSSFKKWSILSIIFLVQVSMNFNASLYANAVSGISKEFKVGEQMARCGAMIFLVAYAFGRKLQYSIKLVDLIIHRL
jgi:hypothetical protein